MPSCRIFAIGLRAALVASLVACGGSQAPSKPASATDAKDAPPPESTTTEKDGAPLDKHAAAEALPHDDPNEKEGPIPLAGLVAKGTPKSAFPKATIGDHDCLKELAFVGKHKQDYATLVGRCGTPTGMLKYTEPAEGRLHHKKDKRDHFQLKVYKGMCYRYFAVADDGVKDIDILVLKKGALLAMDKTEHPVAIIDTDKLWCVDDDMDLDFAVEVDGGGAGGYTFGVWTRPK